MDDDVDVVQQDPAGLAVALAAHRLGAELLVQPLLDLVNDRLDLAVVGRGGEQEGVRDGQHVADVVRDDVVRELVGGRLRGHIDQLDGAIGGSHPHPFGGTPAFRTGASATFGTVLSENQASTATPSSTSSTGQVPTRLASIT